MADVPHFSIPFRWDHHHHAVVVEQDSDEDITACVEAIVRTPAGARSELPGFGIQHGLFSTDGPDSDEMVQAVAEHEPRASLEAVVEWLDPATGVIGARLFPATEEP